MARFSLTQQSVAAGTCRGWLGWKKGSTFRRCGGPAASNHHRLTDAPYAGGLRSGGHTVDALTLRQALSVDRCVPQIVDPDLREAGQFAGSLALVNRVTRHRPRPTDQQWEVDHDHPTAPSPPTGFLAYIAHIA